MFQDSNVVLLHCEKINNAATSAGNHIIIE